VIGAAAQSITRDFARRWRTNATPKHVERFDEGTYMADHDKDQLAMQLARDEKAVTFLASQVLSEARKTVFAELRSCLRMVFPQGSGVR